MSTTTARLTPLAVTQRRQRYNALSGWFLIAALITLAGFVRLLIAR